MSSSSSSLRFPTWSVSFLTSMISFTILIFQVFISFSFRYWIREESSGLSSFTSPLFTISRILRRFDPVMDLKSFEIKLKRFLRINLEEDLIAFTKLRNLLMRTLLMWGLSLTGSINQVCVSKFLADIFIYCPQWIWGNLLTTILFYWPLLADHQPMYAFHG